MSENETSIPKSLEELFISKYVDLENELESIKAELSSKRRALDATIKELKMAKNILSKYIDPVMLNSDGNPVGGNIRFYLSCDSWDYSSYPERKAEVEYLKTIVHIVSSEESETKPEEEK